jgi:hypothetical protein
LKIKKHLVSLHFRSLEWGSQDRRHWLCQRRDEGICSTEQLYQAVRGRGNRGSLRTLRWLTAQLRRDTAV